MPVAALAQSEVPVHQTPSKLRGNVHLSDHGVFPYTPRKSVQETTGTPRPRTALLLAVSSCVLLLTELNVLDQHALPTHRWQLALCFGGRLCR